MLNQDGVVSEGEMDSATSIPIPDLDACAHFGNDDIVNDITLQETAIRAEEAAKTPFVGDKEPLSSLAAEYQSGSGQRRNKRLNWSKADDLGLISAWLNNSNDPIEGNSKKGNVYWKQVAEDYNNNSPRERRRESKHCKDHWGKTNKKVVYFHGCWKRMRAVYTSGQSDDQLIDKAREMYKDETGQHFTLDYWWKEARNQPKWEMTYPCTGESKRTKLSESGNYSSSQDIKEHEKVDLNQQPRPLGQKAVRAKRKGKLQSSDNLSHEDVQTYYNFQSVRFSTVGKVEKILELQLQLSKEKAKTKLINEYVKLVLADTLNMTDFQKREHERALKYFSLELIGGDN